MAGIFLRSCKRRKNGKEHRYFSLVESRRMPGGKVVQRQVLCLGEINDSPQAAWRKSLEVFDEDGGESRQMNLFPDDRPIPPDALDAVQVKLTQMVLRRPRAFGDCWLGCELWRQLELDRFWDQRLAGRKGDVPWAKVVQLLAINRLIEPGSEFRVHRHWFGRTAMDEVLQVDALAASKDRLYRCLDIPGRPQARSVQAPAAAVAGPVCGRVRYPALRPDQHVLRGALRGQPAGQARLQPRRAGRLPPGDDRPGGHAARPAAGL